MLQKESKAIPKGNGPVPQQEEFGSDEPTLADVYRTFKERFDRWDRKLDEMAGDWRSMDQRLTGPHAFGPKYVYIGHKILMKQPHDCSYLSMGARPNRALLKKTERKLKSPLGEPRITEQPRRHGSSARYIRDPLTQGYRPGGACRSCCTIPRKSSWSPGPFLVVSHYTIWTTVITLQIPPVTYGPRTSSV